MGSLNDIVTIYVTTYAQDATGSTRSNSYTKTTTLGNYVSDVNTFATPLISAVTAERAVNSGRVDLHATVQIGQQPFTNEPLSYHYAYGALATPSAVAHMTIQDQFSDFQITNGMDINTWLSGIITRYLPINLYPDVNIK